MLKLFNIFKTGFKTIFTSPFWIFYLLYKLLFCLVMFFKNFFIAIIYFFQGKSLFQTKEDKAIAKLKEDDQKILDLRREEALRNVD